MASTINATGSGIVLTGSTSAALNLLVGGSAALSIGTGATLTISNPSTFPAGSASAPAITTTGDTNTGMYFPAADEVAVAAGGSVAAAFNTNGLFFRNRIINGDMRIDQRNAAVTASGVYGVDRWQSAFTTSGAISIQQDSSVPSNAGFINSTKITITTADASIAASDLLQFQQWIEGNNIADLGFGTSGAKTVTVSFWVRASVTGTYAVIIGNSNAGTSAPNRTYVSTYTINSADTWEYKTVTVPGDTGGTWQTGSLRGMLVRFGLTAGTDYQQAAGSWGTISAAGTSSTVQLLSTLNATWYVTGVQFESGSVSTPFERRPYGTELNLCYRYYYRLTADDTSYGFSGAYADSATRGFAYGQFPVTMRTTPTALEQNGTAANYNIRSGGADRACSAVAAYNSATTQNFWQVETTVASGQTAGQAGYFFGGAIGAYLGWSAEL